MLPLRLNYLLPVSKEALSVNWVDGRLSSVVLERLHLSLKTLSTNQTNIEKNISINKQQNKVKAI